MHGLQVRAERMRMEGRLAVPDSHALGEALASALGAGHEVPPRSAHDAEVGGHHFEHVLQALSVRLAVGGILCAALGDELLRTMYQRWFFFENLIDDIELSLARADTVIRVTSSGRVRDKKENYCAGLRGVVPSTT
jgi:hypothetical protein